MLDFSKPIKMELTGESVRYICADVVEIGYARVCVDPSTGIIYSGPHQGRKIVQCAPQRPNTASSPTALAASDGKDQALPAQRLKPGS